MLDFLKRVAVGVAVALSVFFLKQNVFAATISAVDGRLRYTANGVQTDPAYTTGSLSVNVPSNGEYYLTRLFTRFRFSTALSANTAYAFEFNWNLNQRAFTPLENANFNYSYSVSDLKAVSCSTTTFPSDLVLRTNCTLVTGSTAVSTMTFGVIPTNRGEQLPILPGGTSTYTFGTYSFVNDADTPSIIIGAVDGLGNQIESIDNHVTQNQSIANTLLETINNTLNNIVSGNAPNGGHLGWNGISYNDNSSGITDTCIDDICYTAPTVLEFHEWSTPFEFIWMIINRFIALNEYILICIIFVLTLSFAALVIGRF